MILAHVQLMKHLNAAHGSYFLSRTFAHLVCFFRPPKADPAHALASEAARQEEAAKGEEAVRRVEPYVHDLLRDLLRYARLMTE